MDEVAHFVGDLFCLIPLGLDQCASDAGKIVIGNWAVMALLGAMAGLLFLHKSRASAGLQDQDGDDR